MADEFCLKMPEFHVTFRDLLHAVNLRHGTNGFTSFPKKGVLRIFSPWKIRRLRPGLNPRTWVPKASTLPLDHRSRLVPRYITCRAKCLLPLPVFIPFHRSLCTDNHRLAQLYVTFLKTSLTSFLLDQHLKNAVQLLCRDMQTKPLQEIPKLH